jgi:HemK-related putative methylase
MTKLYYNDYVLDISNTIYYPSDDTYLLLDTLKKEISLYKHINFALEVGCGSSILSLYLYDFVNKMFCVDINEDVIDYLENVKKKYSLNKLEIIKSDLFKNLNKNKLDFKTFDIIVFNPPYVCSEKLNNLNIKKEDLCTIGGINGSEVIFRFLENLNNYLNKKSVCYLLISSQNNIKNIYKRIIELNFNYKVVNSKKLFFEELFVIKIQKNLLNK